MATQTKYRTIVLVLSLLVAAYGLWLVWHHMNTAVQDRAMNFVPAEALPREALDAAPAVGAPPELPPEIAAKVSQWSTSPSKLEVAAVPGGATSSTVPADKLASPFPEPKKVLTPEEIESGSW